jgi:conjugative relaxase-like TrwC/TraI family protein
MLSIRAAKAVAYYEAPEFAAEDYYAEGGRAAGRWAGRGAEARGLAGEPGGGDLAALLAGRDPSSGAELAGGRGRRPSNVAFDLTFAAPKSVSVLMALADEETRRAVIEAHEAGVRACLAYLEREACFVRRGRNGVEVLPGEGFIGAAYTHEMARSGDPHLHTHLVIANRVKGPDGRYTAPDMRPVYGAAKTAGTIADAVTRERLSRWLGVEWAAGANGIVELAGVPEGVREHFSARHAEILEEAHARGWGTSPAALAVLQRETRDHKPRIDRERAQADWRARAAEHGLGAEGVGRLLGAARRVREAQRRARLAQHVEWMASSAGLIARDSTFTRGQVIEALAAGHPEGVRAAQLEALADRFLETRALVIAPARIEPGRGRVPARFTTPEHLATEIRLIELACGEDAAGPLVAPAEAVERAIAARPTLGEDQAAAVRALCGGNGRVRVLEARAGSGKSFALAAVREAYAAAGVPVVGTAWQGRAAEVLGREAGVESQTTALLLERIARGEEPIPRGAVVIVDEAGSMPTHAMERLVSAVADRSGRVILAGDSRQLPSIAAGGALAGLAERLGAAELTGNRRQADPLQREVARLLSEGEAGCAVALLAAEGRLQGYHDGRAARAALIARWREECLHEPERGLILAHDRREVAALNTLARAERDKAGLLGLERLHAGGREWAVGDRLTCRRNDYRLGVRNGTRGSVVAVGSRVVGLTLRTDEGRTVRLPAAYLEYIEHGYAATGHVSQGETVDRIYLLASGGRGGREWAYVAGNRHRIDLRVFSVGDGGCECALAAAWSRSQAKRIALELVDLEPSAVVDAVRNMESGCAIERR